MYSSLFHRKQLIPLYFLLVAVIYSVIGRFLIEPVLTYAYKSRIDEIYLLLAWPIFLILACPLIYYFLIKHFFKQSLQFRKVSMLAIGTGVWLLIVTLAIWFYAILDYGHAI